MNTSKKTFTHIRKKKKKLKGLTPSGIVPRAYHRDRDTGDLNKLLDPKSQEAHSS